jgi:hypothetical protein
MLPSVREARAIQRQRSARRAPTPAQPAPAVPVTIKKNEVGISQAPAPPRAPSQQPEGSGRRPFDAIQIDHALAEAEAKRTAALSKLEQAARTDAKTLRASPTPQPTAERAFGDAARQQARDVRVERREESFRADQTAWKNRIEESSPAAPKPVDKGLRVVSAATGLVSRLGDFVIDLLAGSPPPREGRVDMNAFVTDPAARKQQQLDRLAAMQQAENDKKAIESIREDMQSGRNLKADDIRHLTRQHQEQIRMFGDDAVRQMVDDARKYSERHWKGEERERER